MAFVSIESLWKRHSRRICVNDLPIGIKCFEITNNIAVPQLRPSSSGRQPGIQRHGSNVPESSVVNLTADSAPSSTRWEKSPLPFDDCGHHRSRQIRRCCKTSVNCQIRRSPHRASTCPSARTRLSVQACASVAMQQRSHHSFHGQPSGWKVLGYGIPLPRESDRLAHLYSGCLLICL